MPTSARCGVLCLVACCQKWQVGTPPSPRHLHTATLFGVDLLIVGGLPVKDDGHGGQPVVTLNLAHATMQTSAALAPRLAHAAELNASCTLQLGSPGSPVQRWSCARSASLPSRSA
jgi:hypothetical protein